MSIRDDYLDREILMLSIMEQEEDQPEAMTQCQECGRPIPDDSLYPTCDDCEAH